MGPQIIFFSSLFPNPFYPVRGLFVSELASSLNTMADISVLAPVIAHRNLKHLWRIPTEYLLANGLRVHAPIAFNFPKILKSTDAILMAICSRPAFEKAIKDHRGIVHAHFAYPDAVAAWKLAAKHNLPFVVTVHGSDINVLAKSRGRRGQIVQMLARANAIICVTRNLAQQVAAFGVSTSRIHHIPNGVDPGKFTPGDRQVHRVKLGLEGCKKLILTVGNLVPVKGYERLIQALANTDPEISLVMVGAGPEGSRLIKLVGRLGLENRVHFAGSVPHHELVTYYRAADFLVISSYSEGWPTVIFEAFACGLPVIANSVGGIPDALCSPGFGLLMANNESSTIAQSLTVAYRRKWDCGEAISFARENTWDKIAARHLEIYETIQK
jgi:teichuronic acid biosynthesis glycosyltransferase TuaC